MIYIQKFLFASISFSCIWVHQALPKTNPRHKLCAHFIHSLTFTTWVYEIICVCMCILCLNSCISFKNVLTLENRYTKHFDDIILFIVVNNKHTSSFTKLSPFIFVFVFFYLFSLFHYLLVSLSLRLFWRRNLLVFLSLISVKGEKNRNIAK